jgi:hypothetical protein
MKLKDIEAVNHLVAELQSVGELIAIAQHAEPVDCQLFIKGPGEASIEMSAEGASSTRYRGFSTSTGFLSRLKDLALEEIHSRRRAIIAELAALGVDAEG